MTAEKLRLSEIRYNPERAGFEALVTVHEAGRSFRYPAFVSAPLHAEFTLIARGLTERALSAHKSARPGLRAALRLLVKSPVVKPLAAGRDLPPLAA